MYRFNKEKLLIEYAGCSDIGLVRTENQDTFGIYTSDDLKADSVKGHLFVVADGMGGHKGGKEASNLAVSTIKEIYYSTKSSDPVLILKKAIEAANTKIYSTAQKSENYRRMGTTCSVLLIKKSFASFGHIGDSRIYKVENNNIEQLTTDHTKVNELLKEGILTKEEAEGYPAKSVLTRALGVNDNVKIDYNENIKLKEGQIYVLCSDGLANVTENEIKNLVILNGCEEACEKLVALANERGGYDNVTILIIKIVNKK